MVVMGCSRVAVVGCSGCTTLRGATLQPCATSNPATQGGRSHADERHDVEQGLRQATPGPQSVLGALSARGWGDLLALWSQDRSGPAMGLRTR